jgi:hypothetical protein
MYSKKLRNTSNCKKQKRRANCETEETSQCFECRRAEKTFGPAQSKIHHRTEKPSAAEDIFGWGFEIVGSYQSKMERSSSNVRTVESGSR